MSKVCSSCKLESAGVFSGHHESMYSRVKNQDYCPKCSHEFFNSKIEPIIATTTGSIDGYTVERYIGIESVEVVIGTGVFSEFAGDIADMMGSRSTAFEIKMQNAKNVAISRLKTIAYEKDGNAIIGIDVDYTEFSNNRIGVIANGTLVKIVKIFENTDEKLLNSF